jgi:hypothetical protein
VFLDKLEPGIIKDKDLRIKLFMTELASSHLALLLIRELISDAQHV